MEPVSSTVSKSYPPRGPLQQFRFQEATAFQMLALRPIEEIQADNHLWRGLVAAAMQRLLRPALVALRDQGPDCSGGPES
jgi:hypothetical protein